MQIKTVLQLREAVRKKVQSLALSDDMRFIQLKRDERGQQEVHLLSSEDGNAGLSFYSGTFLPTGYKCPNPDNPEQEMEYFIRKDHVGLVAYWLSNGMASRPSKYFTNLTDVTIDSLTDEQLVQLSTKLLNI